MKFLNKKSFRLISVVTLIVVSMMIFNLSLNANDQEGLDIVKEGIERYKNAYFEEAVELLTKAIELNLNRATEINACIYLALSSLALEDVEGASNYVKRIIKLDHSFVLNTGEFSPEFLVTFNKIKDNYPIIYNFSVSPEIFYPYQGEKSYIEFSLSKSDLVSIEISSGNLNLSNDEVYADSSSNEKFSWEWSDSLINKNELDIYLFPKLNRNDYSFSKKIALNVLMPPGLRYDNDEFRIQGRHYLPETITKKKLKMLGASIAIGIVSIGLGILFVSHKTEWDESWENRVLAPVLAFGFGAAFLSYPIWAGEKNYEKFNTTSPKNIAKNNKLKKDIQKMMKKIEVKQEVKK